MRALLLISIIVLAACRSDPLPAPLLVLLPPTSDEVEERGVSRLLASRLRAISGVRLVLDERGCDFPGATHALRFTRRTTKAAWFASAELRECRNAAARVETFVFPREAPRDISQGVAFWVAGALGKRGRPPDNRDRIDEATLRQYYSAIGYLQQRERAAVAQALALLDGITQANPNFALGHAEHAIAQLLASEYGLLSVDAAMSHAQASIQRALALDPELGLAHAALGLKAMVAGRYQDALAPLLKAHRADPGHDAILLWLGNAHLYAGQPTAARPWLEAAQNANPALAAIAISLGEADCYAGIDQPCQAFLAAPPALPMQAYVQLLLRAHQGDYAVVREQLRTPPAVSDNWTRALLGDVCRVLGESSCAMPVSPAAADSALPNPDLWQLDLGYGGHLPRARHAPAFAAELRQALADLRKGGVKLEIVEALEACLDGAALSEAQQRLLACEPMD
jgi:tetratricopeptide (TPR) repeat protein